jgi:hypothetical protein
VTVRFEGRPTGMCAGPHNCYGLPAWACLCIRVSDTLKMMRQTLYAHNIRRPIAIRPRPALHVTTLLPPVPERCRWVVILTLHVMVLVLHVAAAADARFPRLVELIACSRFASKSTSQWKWASSSVYVFAWRS